jgi:hypothetical protein
MSDCTPRLNTKGAAYSMTSSASVSRVGGTLSSIAFAVLRLMTI